MAKPAFLQAPEWPMAVGDGEAKQRVEDNKWRGFTWCGMGGRKPAPPIHWTQGLMTLAAGRPGRRRWLCRRKAPCPFTPAPLPAPGRRRRRWRRFGTAEVSIEPRVAEIPFPTTDLSERSRWLRQAMAGGWANLSQDLQLWRRRLVDCVAGLERDCVVFCHFIAINVAVGAAQQDDRLVIFHPDNASVTTFSNEGGKLRLLELGRQSTTKIN